MNREIKFFLSLFFLLPIAADAAQTIDPRLLPSGVPRQIQVDSTNLSGNNPVHIRDTTDLDVANPSAGNIDITIKAGAVTDAKVAAGGITTRTKLPSPVAFEDENNNWSLTNNVTGTWSINGAGSFTLMGSSSGTITIGRQAAAGTYNFNLPTSAGTSGQPLLSGGGGATAMTFGTLGLAHGGTNQSSWTAARCVRVNAGGTALESAAGDCGVGAGAIGQVDGTANEITSTNPTGPTVTLSLPSSLSLGAKSLLGGSPLKFEGTTVNSFSTTLRIADPSANRFIDAANADTVTVQPFTCAGDERVSAISALGAITCATTSGTGDVTDVLGTANEITITNGTGPQPQASLASALNLSTKVLQGGSPLVFEGTTGDANETTVIITDPTAPRTFTIPNDTSVAAVVSSAPSNQFATGISSAGVISYAQPTFTDLGGIATNAQLPFAISGKSFAADNVYAAKDNIFTIEDNGDSTRQGRFTLDSLTVNEVTSWVMPTGTAANDYITHVVGADNSNTYTGTQTQDFSASTTTLRLPLKAMPGSPAIGEMAINSADLYWRDNAGTPTNQRAVKASEMDAASGVAILDSSARLVARLQEYTVATLPASPGTNRLVIVTDAASSSTCSTGGSTNRVLCHYNGISWSALGGGGGGSTGLDANFTVDKRIRAANSLANAFFVGSDDGSNGLVFYTDEATGPVFSCIVAGVVNDCDKAFKLATGKAWALLRADNSELESLTEAGVHTYTGVGRPKKSAYWDAGAISTDGTNCATATEQTLNSGPKTWAFSCADSNSSIFYGKARMPDGYDGGTVTFQLSLFHGTTETITFAGDFDAQCRGDGEAVSSTWGTAIAADVAITTANNIVSATTAAVTPAGTCAGGDMMFWRYVVDETNFSANSANAKVLGVKMEYSVSSRSD